MIINNKTVKLYIMLPTGHVGYMYFFMFMNYLRFHGCLNIIADDLEAVQLVR